MFKIRILGIVPGRVLLALSVAALTLGLTPAVAWTSPIPPEARDDWYATGVNQTLTVGAPGVLSNDIPSDGYQIYAQKLSDPVDGQVSLQFDGSFVYQPNRAATGRDMFTYIAVDSAGQRSAPATVTIWVS